jgi:SAM-dependent methyltransferase
MAFSAEWLALRAPADLAARDAGLLARAAACVTDGLRVLDLGSGTGSTARAFAGLGCGGLDWTFVDNDPALLEVAVRTHPDSLCVLADLGDLEALPLAGIGLVTASALLDLMPAAWLSGLGTRLRDAGIPFYAALNYDGQMHWTPAQAQDAAITAAFNTHQRGDKGLGPALGPDSGTRAAQLLGALDFHVTTASSPWHIGPDQAALHHQLLDGIGAAAREAGHRAAQDWAAARQNSIATSRAVIGHVDILALPQGYAP